MAIIPHLGDEADPLAYEPDRLGRLGFGRRRRNRPHDPMGRIPRDERRDAWRERWLLGASDDELFPDGPFRLKGRVGKDGENDREDVVKLESALARTGHYDAVSTGGPTGYYGPQLEEAVQRFRADNRIPTNGTVKRGDETMRLLEAKLTQAPRKPLAKRPKAGASRDDSARGASDHEKHAAHREQPFTALMPAPALTKDRLDDFARSTPLELRKRDGGFALTDRKSGKALAYLSGDIAARYVQSWESFSRRTEVLYLFARTDLTDPEKIETANRLLPDVDERDFHGAAIRLPEAREKQKRDNRRRHARNQAARMAFRKALQDVAGGVSREKVLPDLQQALFPELRESGPLREFILDLMPGVGNVRSIGHAANDLSELGDAFSEGDGSAMAWHGAMLLLDVFGILPGGNAIKAAGRGILNITPYGKAAIAQSRLNKAQRQFPKLPDKDENLGARKLLGPEYKTLNKRTKESVTIALNWAVGNAGNRRALEWMLNIDPRAAKPKRVTMPSSYNGPGQYREYDLTTRDLRTVFFDDVLRTRMWILGQKRPEPQPGSHYEIKSGSGEKSKGQIYKDEFLRTNAAAAAATGVTDIREARLYLKQIPFEYIVEDATERLNSMVRNRTISKQVANDVMRALKKVQAAGAAKVRPADYADLMVRLAVSSLRTGEQLAPDFMGP